MTGLGIGVIAAALATAAAGQTVPAATCDSACLSQVMSSFIIGLMLQGVDTLGFSH